MKLLAAAGCDPKGKTAVVVGRSNIVGKPVALMLLEKHATVTICHSRTASLRDEVGRADIFSGRHRQSGIGPRRLDQARRGGDRRRRQSVAERQA